MKIPITFIVRFIFLIPILLGAVNHITWAQPIDAGPNLAVCPGTPVNLTATINLGMPSAGPATNVTNIMSCDDCNSPVVNIGFTFNFYGNNYTQCVISSNGYITFDLSVANGYSPWSITAAIPNAGLPLNAIMAPWQDINPSMGTVDIIRYQLFGTAPNRVFVVEYLDVPMFSCGQSFCYGAQIKLYEGTNVIETHIANKPLCSQWNSGRAIHGLHNANGTIAHVVPGRNYPNQWTATNDGKRFTPNGNNNYTITNIPFSPTILGTTPPNNAFQWFIAGNPTVQATGLTYNPTPTTTTNYVIRYTYSSCGGFTFSDTVTVSMIQITPQIAGVNTYCTGDSTKIYTTQTYSAYLWSNGATTDSIWVTQGSYTVQVTDANGCTGNSPPFQVSALPLPQPVITGPTEYCAGSNVNLQTTQNYQQYAWSTGDVTSSITVTAGDYTVTVTDANGCVSSSQPFTVTENPLPEPVIQGQNIYCEGGPNVLSTTLSYANYVWSNNTYNSTLTLYGGGTGSYVVTVTDNNNCVGTSAPFDVVEVILTPAITGVQDFCEGSSINLGVSNGPYAGYLWSTGSSAPEISVTGGTYTVTVTDINGCSKSASAFAPATPSPTVAFYATPQPALISAPVITFVNASSPDAITFHWDFAGFGSSTDENPIFEFTEPGFWNVTLQVWNYLGCTNSVTQTIEIKPQSEIYIPNAFTPNGDGINDVFFAHGNDLVGRHVEVHIFNRWGQRVYYGTSIEKPWDGRCGEEPCPEGVYVYRIFYKNQEGKVYRFMGNVNLIR